MSGMSGSEFFNSLVSSKFELAPALAKINFDFALCKIEAPPEYRAIGAALSQTRRQDAEDGRSHVTARKLGALFEEIIPETPALLRAYGERASEIFANSRLDDPTLKSYGAFATSAGVDATSLWAAATSGKGAIAVHLLACMLARIWDSTKATSIWVELVEIRRKNVFSQLDQDNQTNMGSLMAAKQEVSREQLREWDASARAWLHAADSAKSASQKQLMLIINNLDVSVNRRPSVYESVVEAWKDSLEQMEHLLNGFGQRAHSGSILLALSSWHLYPNMTILMPVIKDVILNDPLVPSVGVLTLGMEPTSQLSETNGLHWSLPLSHLRRYGRPVKVKSSVDIESSARLSLAEFKTAYLGCFLAIWGPAPRERDASIAWLRWLLTTLEKKSKSHKDYSQMAADMLGTEENACWLGIVLRAAKRYEEHDQTERRFPSKLLLLGEKHGNTFLGKPQEVLFGLNSMGRFLRYVKDSEARIAYLRMRAREIAQEYDIAPQSFIIRYICDGMVEFASALPWHVSPLLRTNPKLRHSHFRCVDDTGRLPTHTSLLYLERVGREVGGSNIPSRRYSSRHRKVDQGTDRRHLLASTGEVVMSLSTSFFDDLHSSVGLGAYHDCEVPFPERGDYNNFSFYVPVHGDQSTAMLYCSKLPQKPCDLPVNSAENISRQMFTWTRTEKIYTGRLIRDLYSHFLFPNNVNDDPFFMAVRAVSTVIQLCGKMPNATLDVRVLRNPLYEMDWIDKTSGEAGINGETRKVGTIPSSLMPYNMTRDAIFACILWFETLHNIPTDFLSYVLAISTTSSLYIASGLLLDPWIGRTSQNVSHVPGNIGHSGIALLIPPPDPMICEFDLQNWRESGGLDPTLKGKDCFPNTTLHLAFTDSKDTLALGGANSHDPEVYFLETLVRVYDRGDWIADLDINGALLWPMKSKAMQLIRPCGGDHNDAENHDFEHQFVSLDTWTSILDATESHTNVVCARSNWQARLAAAIVCQALGYQTWVAPERGLCWECFFEAQRTAGPSKSDKVVIID